MVLSLRAVLRVKDKAPEHEPGPVVPPAGCHAAPALARVPTRKFALETLAFRGEHGKHGELVRAPALEGGVDSAKMAITKPQIPNFATVDPVIESSGAPASVEHAYQLFLDLGFLGARGNRGHLVRHFVDLVDVSERGRVIIETEQTRHFLQVYATAPIHKILSTEKRRTALY